jgi:hypothetical protein
VDDKKKITDATKASETAAKKEKDFETGLDTKKKAAASAASALAANPNDKALKDASTKAANEYKWAKTEYDALKDANT